MKSWRWNINGILCALALGLFFCGCKTTEEKKAGKEQTLIYFHLETIADGNPRNKPVPIYRQNPQQLLINSISFLDNGNITEAAVVEVEGGFGIKIVFDQHGRLVLENYTATHPGKRIAINAAFPEIRWLAAPRITRRIPDGVFIFTPDASRAEAERIVRGVNNVSKKVRQGVFQ